MINQNQQSFKKRHGSTTFHVNIYSNPNAKETAEDKIARLIRNEAASSAYNDFPTKAGIV